MSFAVKISLYPVVKPSRASFTYLISFQSFPALDSVNQLYIHEMPLSRRNDPTRQPTAIAQLLTRLGFQNTTWAQLACDVGDIPASLTDIHHAIDGSEVQDNYISVLKSLVQNASTMAETLQQKQ
jgi:hypothetical protein